MKSDHVVLDCAVPFGERISRIAEAWTRDGRDRGHLVTGKAFFAVHSWHLRHRIDPDTTEAEYVTASHEAIGGDEGWEAMLRERVFCESCGDRYRLENIGLCTGCMRYACYVCATHGSCTGELV
ncbi:hypothetical protein [Streptomyces sp. NPDC051567]|uniref:hypothetical protein n=1 Tax=Streptomyces sp. NPDC051567 TaxID=3365660 RepID=UPI0037AA3C5E